MNNPLDNVRTVHELLDKVVNHRMCVKLSATPNTFKVYFPPGYDVDGVRVSKGMGKAKALEKLFEIMERY